ncbi:MAG TPA: electron transfer flavoprotein subunit beta/FixA family protein [Syntrophales bacterium]|nr:electron transfer flavoprotein subunit beta/FixA family protein [Syntrophales bacterium]
MSFHCIVCIKQVPHPGHFSKINLDPVTGAIRRAGIPSVLNPLDKNVIEEALCIRERFSGKVTAITMGPPQAREVLEEAYALGADEGVLLCDLTLAGADSLATAYTLAKGIQKIGKYDLVLCGNESIDGATQQVGPQLAELLGIPHVTHVVEVNWLNEREAVVKRAIEYGYLKVKVKMPAVMTVVKSINTCRLPSVLDIMGAAGKEVQKWGCCDINGATECVGLPGSPTRVIGIVQVESKRKREMLKGSEEEMAKSAVKRLREYGVI